MTTDQQINDAWAEHRSHLVDLAFRMLSDIGEAEDVVQEAFYRLSRSDFDSIEDARGWLIVVTSRLCLDVIRSARARREQSADDATLQGGQLTHLPLILDPGDRVTLDDSVRLALLVVLERLSPAERVTFVLHDIFGVPFDTIAETVGRPEASCRQLARRARLKLEAPDAPSRVKVTSPEHRLVTERFIAACANGSFEDLITVLSPDVSGVVDLRPGLVVRGADRVGRNIIAFWGTDATMVSLPVAGRPCVLAFLERELAAVIDLNVVGDRITKIHVTADPARLGPLSDELHALA